MKIDLGAGKWDIFDVAAAVDGSLIVGDETDFNGICTDSREAAPGVLFVALRGERVDGHDYISKAVELGCKCILAEHIVLNLLFKMVFYEHLTYAAKSKDFMLMGEFN